MRAFPVVLFLFLFSFTIPFSAQAVSVTNADLPATIQSCITSGSCLVNRSSTYNSEEVSAFAISDESTRARDGTVWAGTNDWLVRYDLVAPSGQTNIDNNLTQAFDGYLWMRVNGAYVAAETAHPVSVFLDKVAPVPDPMLFQNGDLTLFMTTADMLAGGAYIDRQDYEEYGYYSEGTLSGEVPQICLAAGCQISAQLNLLQLTYQNFGTNGIYMVGFDSKDTRGAVYSQSYADLNGDPPYRTTQSFYISAVPEPGASWLFGFGLIGVVAAVRRRRVGRQISEWKKV